MPKNTSSNKGRIKSRLNTRSRTETLSGVTARTEKPTVPQPKSGCKSLTKEYGGAYQDSNCSLRTGLGQQKSSGGGQPRASIRLIVPTRTLPDSRAIASTFGRRSIG